MAGRFRVIRGGVRPGASSDSVSSQKQPFEQALLAHLDRLFAFALRLERGQRERAEDLVQETSLQAFRNYKSLRSADQLKPWLFRILINTRINKFHTEKREPALVDVDITPELLSSARAITAATPEEDFFSQLLPD